MYADVTVGLQVTLLRSLDHSESIFFFALKYDYPLI